MIYQPFELVEWAKLMLITKYPENVVQKIWAAFLGIWAAFLGNLVKSKLHNVSICSIFSHDVIV